MENIDIGFGAVYGIIAGVTSFICYKIYAKVTK